MSHFTFRYAFYRFSSVIREKLICLNDYEKGVRTIHKAKVYTSFLRPEQGCILYTGASYTRKITVHDDNCYVINKKGIF